MSKPASVLLIYTGGTIGMMQDPVSKQLIPLNFEHLSSQLPELKQFDYNIGVHSFDKPIDSSNMNPKIWKELALIIERNYNDYDGFVILHGSDTMAYTASALSFMLENLNKPVILTGSQLPIGMIRTDGKENIISAIEIAAAKSEKGEAMVPEVAIYFEYRLHRGNRTTKISATNFNAFQSSNYPDLAEAGVTISYDKSKIKPASNKELKVNLEMDNQVMILKLYPGINENYLKAVLEIKGLRGIILETYGSGNATTDAYFIEFINAAIRKGITIVNCTQCSSGSVILGKYETSAQLLEAGVVSGKDMTTEAALTKLMHLLGKGLANYDIKQAFTLNYCGEITL